MGGARIKGEMCTIGSFPESMHGTMPGKGTITSAAATCLVALAGAAYFADIACFATSLAALTAGAFAFVYLVFSLVFCLASAGFAAAGFITCFVTFFPAVLAASSASWVRLRKISGTGNLPVLLSA